MRIAGVFSLSLLANLVSSQACDYYANTPCVKVQASASGTVPFAPLFTQDPILVYAIDDTDEADRKTILEKVTFGPANVPQIQVIGIWLEFPPSAVNFNPNNKRQYVLASLFTNVSSSVGGPDNGCGNLLGAACVKNLKDTIKLRLGSQCHNCVGSMFEDLRVRPLRNLSCPTDLFDDYAAISGSFIKSYATEDDTISGLRPVPGNASHVTAQQVALRDFESQKRKAAIGITISYPIAQSYKDVFTPNDATVEMACVKVDGGLTKTDDRGSVGGRLGSSLFFLTAVAGVATLLIVL